MRDLLEAAKAELATILQAPAVDPDAPAGYVRREWAEADTRRRHAEALAIIRRTVAEIGQRYGALIASGALEHFAPLLVLLGGTELH